MGKDLRGKELGEGVSQRKDGKYIARYRMRDGTRPEKSFTNVTEALIWLTTEKYNYEQSEVGQMLGNTTMNDWFDYWVNNIKLYQVKKTTLKGYVSKYKTHIHNHLGHMKLSNIKTIHCQSLITDMIKKDLSPETIKLVKNLLYSVLESAKDNELIDKNPVNKSIIVKSSQKKKEPRVLTREEQSFFLQEFKSCRNYNLFAFLLQTGLRIGEETALKWSDIDFEKKEMYIQRNLYFDEDTREYVETTPKSKSGFRTVPLTDEAICILQSQKYKMKKLLRKKSTVDFQFIDYVFINQNGKPFCRSNLDGVLATFCKENNMEHFSLHSLRHTFATRCIESGMKPKTLQKILGHSSITITMDTYVHTTGEEMHSEMAKLQGLA